MAIQSASHRGDADPFGSGVQVTSWVLAKASGLAPSMGGVGVCYNNAMIESFWSWMQVEPPDRYHWRTRLEPAPAIFEYLEIFCQRRHRALRTLSPVQFENRQPTTVA